MGLFGFLRRKRRRRHLFHWRDGVGREHAADPILLWQALEADKDLDIETHGPLAAAGDIDAQLICARAAIRALGSQEFGPDRPAGLTIMEGLALLVSFVDFVAELKKNTAPWPTSQSPTDSGESRPPVRNGSPSGSCATGPNLGTPHASTSESVPP